MVKIIESQGEIVTSILFSVVFPHVVHVQMTKGYLDRNLYELVVRDLNFSARSFHVVGEVCGCETNGIIYDLAERIRSLVHKDDIVVLD